MNTKEILSKQLELISVPKSEVSELESLANNFIKSLNAKGLKAKVGGSLAKTTLIKKESKQDIDIFVIFDYSEDIIDLEKKLRSIKFEGKLKKVHGSRDYFQIECENAILEIIPVVKNSDPELAENVTDVSLSHVRYITDEIKKNPKIADEIKLAKSFCKANKFYGAESYIKGFSGYSLEILIIHFGGFLKFLKGIQKTNIVDTMKYFRGEKEIMRELNSSKLNSPVIVIDPTYKYRNATAGLGLETFSKFLDKSKEFLKSPSLDFFKEKKIDVENLKVLAKKRKATLLEINMTTTRQEGDIAGTKMKKVFELFIKKLEKKQQEIIAEEFIYSDGQSAKGYLIILEKPEIEVRGPPIGLETPIQEFKKARKNIYKKKNFYYCKENVKIENILSEVKKVENEIGATIEIEKI